ncbi:radical SAM protein [Lacrimispora sp. NSJ-141]|uniref:Radical SAM protein n=1 Tax=Lientehia hominis TaxID=2897778 RepID=A0AAP2RIS7_9FIRM|nr:radical SAM protein [Lientehia hominis]MCD2492601.1 radical SAM protein [Lientehia hominis]
MQEFRLERYLTSGVERLVKEITEASDRFSPERIFMVKYALAVKKAGKRREKAEKMGEHIPPFLIASITERCNLHCRGCYARANHACGGQEDGGEMLRELTKKQWGNIFSQAVDLGVSFILLAGGEPLVRRDVLEEAARHESIMFPVFTNGTLLDTECGEAFASGKNLIPILSMEGGQETTDLRRGTGIYSHLVQLMEGLKEQKKIFGVSVTVTCRNLEEVMSNAFIQDIKERGCRAVIFVEYVPVEKGTSELAPGEEERCRMDETVQRLRKKYEDMIFISFPGDEKASGGCLAAGRGFFHINARGGAEPCPFAPYSDTDLLHTSLRDALGSPLFQRLRTEGILEKDHKGGCVLFGQEQSVKNIWENKRR